MNNSYLQEILAEADRFLEEVGPAFAGLSPEQLNWKPSAKRWSIAQCLQHIIISNKLYFPIFVQIADGTRRVRKRERVPLLPKVWGKMIVSATAPEATRKTKTAPHLEPSTSDIDPGIVGEVEENMLVLRDLMLRTDKVDHADTIITSPVAGFVTYSLTDCCTLIVRHAHRHLDQARAVQQEAGFPKGEIRPEV